jgi:hypothetical protein
MRLGRKLALAAAIMIGGAIGALGQYVYVSDGTTPWGDSGIWNDMSAALPGTSYETFGVAGTTVFNPANKVILIEGGNNYSTDFDAYFNTPGVVAAAQSWVAAGGSLIINGGRWTFDNLNLGFGLTMENPNYAEVSSAVTVVDPRISTAGSPDGLWQTIFTLAGAGSKTGGSGFMPMILTSSGSVYYPGFVPGLTCLGEEDYGNGIVIAGGLTSPGYQWGSGTSYGGNYFSHDFITYVPDAGTTASLLGLALSCLACFRSRKQ